MTLPTKKRRQSCAGKYARLLSSDDDIRRKIEDSLDLLKLKKDFVYISALVNQLYLSFRYFSDHVSDDSFVSEWTNIWKHANESVVASPSKFPAPKVPAKGHNKDHPILTAFGREVLVDCEFVHCSRVLFFRSLWLNQLSADSTRAEEIARQIRLCTLENNSRAEYVRKLKFTDKGQFGNYLTAVASHLKKEFDTGELSTSEELLVKALSHLFDFQIDMNDRNTTSDRPRTIKPINRKDSSHNGVDFGFTSSRTQKPIHGIITSTSSLSESENKFDIQESTFTASIESNDEPFEANDIANLNRSLRWLHNTRSLSPSSPRRYNRIERANFLQLLRNLSSEQLETSITFYLLYLLGLNIDEIWKLKLGNQFDISTRGIFFKSLAALDYSYVPPEQFKHIFEKKLERLELPLPDELSELIQKLPDKDGELLVSSFSVDRHEMKNRIQLLIDGWRKLGNARFHYNRVGAALSTELMITTNDPLITYLLSGEFIHLSPTLRFYRPTSEVQLQSCWNTVMSKLLLLPI